MTFQWFKNFFIILPETRPTSVDHFPKSPAWYLHALITIHFLGTHNRFHVCVSGVLFLLRFTCSGCFPGSNWPAAAPFSTQFNPAWDEPGEWKYCEDRPIWECCSNISEGLIDWENVIVYKNAFFYFFRLAENISLRPFSNLSRALVYHCFRCAFLALTLRPSFILGPQKSAKKRCRKKIFI